MKKTQSGQALVIILLVMAVGLTIALSIISRSITDIRISQQEEESARAFFVAEAGIEEALKAWSLPEGKLEVPVGEITAYVSESPQGGGRDFDFGGGKFEEGDVQTVWLIEHTNGELSGPSFPANGSIKVCWGEDAGNRIAIEVSSIYKDTDNEFKVARGAYDADFTRGNNFDRADYVGGSHCGDLVFAEDIDIGGEFGINPNATLYALRLKLLYNSDPQPLAVSGSDNFPSQGKCFISTATVEESGITRKVQQCQFHKAPPGIFDYVLYSGGELTK